MKWLLNFTSGEWQYTLPSIYHCLLRPLRNKIARCMLLLQGLLSLAMMQEWEKEEGHVQLPVLVGSLIATLLYAFSCFKPDTEEAAAEQLEQKKK